jgi:hypothetical protein
MTGLKRSRWPLGDADQGIGLGQGLAHRLLDQHVEPGLEAILGHGVVRDGRHRDDDGVGEVGQLLVIGHDNGAIGCRDRLGALVLRVADGGEFGTLDDSEFTGVKRAEIAGADHGNANLASRH